MVWFSSALFFMLFLYHAPMVLIVRAAWDEDAGAWISAGAALHPFMYEHTLYISRFPKKKKRRDAGAHAAWKASEALLRRKGVKADIRAEIGMGDAAATALLCGGCYALAGKWADGIDLRVFPQYTRENAHLALRGMIKAKTGHIALAAAAYFMQKGRRKNGQKTH